MKRTGPTNLLLRKLADELEKAGRRNNARVWVYIADMLRRPTRARVAVNLSKINRYANEGEMVLVPGKVLGGGVLEKKVTIAAYSFSREALDKIRKSGSKAITLAEAVKINPRGANTRVIV